MDLLHANSTGWSSDIQGKNAAMGILGSASVNYDIDIDYKFVPSGDQMAEAKWFHMMKTAMKSFSISNYLGQDKVQIPAMAIVDANGNQLVIDPHDLHVEYSGTITVNGSGEIDVVDQEIIPAVQANKRLSIHSIYISTTSVEGTISLDFAGDTAKNVFKFFCENGSMDDDIQKHAVSALAESLKLTGTGLSLNETIYFSIQAVAE